jgi:predicted nucleic acid-binding protein
VCLASAQLGPRFQRERTAIPGEGRVWANCCIGRLTGPPPFSFLFAIDACCTLNLPATRIEVEIVGALNLHLLDTPQVSGEPLTLWTPPDADGQRAKEPTSTDPLRRAGHLETRPLDGDALVDAFVAAAAQITDTDASCIALAGVLKIPLLTDDRKERRIARELFPAIEIVSTLDVIADGESALHWTAADLVRVARDLRWRGNFAPPRSDSRASWYEALLGGEPR